MPIWADSDERDVQLATEAAKNAFASWSKTSAEERSRIIVRIADLIEQKLDFLAKAESIDNGKPLKLAKTVDIPRASANFRFYGTAILHFASKSHYMEDLAINYTLKEPIGVVGCISPVRVSMYPRVTSFLSTPATLTATRHARSCRLWRTTRRTRPFELR